MSAPTYAPRPKESGHWYDRHTRKLVETVTLKNGKTASPTLRHAREHGWLPGQTTITKCAAAQQLEAWKRKQAVMAALTLPRIPGETDEAFIARVEEDGAVQAQKAAEAGTAIHAAVQEYYTTGRVSGDPIMLEHVMGVQRVLDQTFSPELSWTPELCVVHATGYATKIDLCSPGLGPSPRPIILDFKTKEFGPDDVDGLYAYDDHEMQLAAGGVAMHGEREEGNVLDGTRAAIVFISRSHPGLSWPVAVNGGRLVRGWRMFQSLLTFWQIKNNYFPSW